jgi:abortive infection bacteriophage resistance protein
MQCQSFGTLTALLKPKALPATISSKIAEEWPLSKNYKREALYPTFNALRYLRNLCAHHEKLLGEPLRIAPPLWQGIDAKKVSHLPNFLCWVEHLLQGVTERDSFSQGLKEIAKATQESCPKSLQLLMP